MTSELNRSRSLPDAQTDLRESAYRGCRFSKNELIPVFGPFRVGGLCRVEETTAWEGSPC